jgi:hypothetical protein
MPSSTLNRPRTRAKPSDWVVIVPGQSPDDTAESAQPVAAMAAPAVARPVLAPRPPRVVAAPRRPTAIPEAVARLAPLALLVAAAASLIWMVLGRDPLLAVGITAPHFEAYTAPSAEQVRFVMNDGWTRTAVVPGAMIMDWREGQPASGLRLTLGSPAAEPEIERMSTDGSRIEEIRYRGSWPGIDTLVSGMPGGWMCVFVVQPGVNPGVIELEYVGASELSMDPSGRLMIRSESGTWIDGTPESWQEGPSGREPVETHFELRGGNTFGFILGSYDTSRPLFVDPPSERIN